MTILSFSFYGCTDDPLTSDKHINIIYEYHDIRILREMYPKRSLLYLLDENGKKKDGYAELYYYEGYDATLAYDKQDNEIVLLDGGGRCCFSYSLDTSICKWNTTDLYYDVYFHNKNERYDVAKIHYSLILEIDVNKKEKERLGGWSIIYPEESISYIGDFGGNHWIGFVQYPRKKYEEESITNQTTN